MSRKYLTSEPMPLDEASKYLHHGLTDTEGTRTVVNVGFQDPLSTLKQQGYRRTVAEAGKGSFIPAVYTPPAPLEPFSLYLTPQQIRVIRLLKVGTWTPSDEVKDLRAETRNPIVTLRNTGLVIATQVRAETGRMGWWQVLGTLKVAPTAEEWRAVRFVTDVLGYDTGKHRRVRATKIQRRYDRSMSGLNRDVRIVKKRKESNNG